VTETKPVVVIGDGWAALGAVGFLAAQGREVRWIAGTGSRMLSPLPTLEATESSRSAAWLWQTLAEKVGVELSQPQAGSYLREFRNKAFREPQWGRSPTPELRRETQGETLAPIETAIPSLFETRFSQTLGEIEEEIRGRLAGSLFPNIRRVSGVLVAGIRVEDKRIVGLSLASGEEIEADEVIFADRWAALGGIEGMPKPLSFARKRGAVGVIQATFSHETPLAIGVNEGFFAALPKESGEEFQRHAWGYFSADGKRSFWTVCLSSEEGEDNHEIAKRLRRMKNTLDKVFTGTSWLPEGKADFMSTLSPVSGEQVRFEEAILFSEGEPVLEPITIPQVAGLSFLTDGYGPSLALCQAGALVGLVEAPEAGPSTEPVAALTSEAPEPAVEATVAGDEVRVAE
jgi:hypothetical protein